MLKVTGKLPTGERLRRIQASSNYTKTGFINQSHTPMLSPEYSYGKVMREYMKTVPGRTPSVAPAAMYDAIDPQSEDLRITWFGHSSYLLQYLKKNILVDPVFSGNASPVGFMVKAFPYADKFSVADMPEIDVLLITHDHYDHLDYKTVSALRNKVKRVVCSLGVGAHLEYWGYAPEIITEIYWDEVAEPLPGMQFTALPARHFSGRGLNRNKTLWSAFALQWKDKLLYLGGDSGYDTHFKSAGERFNTFDLAILECGQYHKAWHYIHMLPEETVQAAQDLNAKVLMPVHWGKFRLSLHPWNEPAERVYAAAQENSMPLLMPRIGETSALHSLPEVACWWRV